MAIEARTRLKADEAVRLLSAAAGTARLYPPSSALPLEAARRFSARTIDLENPMRVTVEPHAFRSSEGPIAEGVSQVRQLAESLYALQVGHLVVAPGVTESETSAFVRIANSEPADVRAEGGIRAALVAAGVSRLAVIELTLRHTDDANLAEIDLVSVPIEDIVEALPGAAERWMESAGSGQGEDEVLEAVGRLESAAQDIAWQRLAEAVMRLDEPTRMRVFASALHADANGARMDGMLAVFAKMKPAALARLLKLVADKSGNDASRIAQVMELPPEALQALEMLLEPGPPAPDEVAPTPDASELAAVVATADHTAELERLRNVAAAPSVISGRALSTAVALSRQRANDESVHVIAECLPIAAQDGAFESVREALRRLDELADNAALALEVESAWKGLHRPEVLRRLCYAPRTDADAAIAGEILAGAGAEGAEALVDSYMHAPRQTRALLRPALRTMAQPIVGIASRRLRADDVHSAVPIVMVLAHLGDSRVVPTMQRALEHLDVEVRRAAVTALAESPGPEARVALAKAVNHWDPTTQRHAVREIGRIGAIEAIPVMSRCLEDINPFGRSHELKKEIVVALESIGSPEVVPVLRRTATRRIVISRKDKELRLMAQRALDSLDSANSPSADEGVDTP